MKIEQDNLKKRRGGSLNIWNVHKTKQLPMKNVNVFKMVQNKMNKNKNNLWAGIKHLVL
jgi:hypothetical protein